MPNETPDQERVNWGERPDEIPASREKEKQPWLQEGTVSKPAETSEPAKQSEEDMKRTRAEEDRKEREQHTDWPKQ